MFIGNGSVSAIINGGAAVQVGAQHVEIDPQNIAILSGYSYDTFNQFDGLNIGTNFTTNQTRMMTFKQNITGGHSQIALIAGPGDASSDRLLMTCLTGDNACSAPKFSMTRDGTPDIAGGYGAAGFGWDYIVASAVNTSGVTTNQSGNLQPTVNGTTGIAPSGWYYVDACSFVSTANTTGTLDVNLGWFDSAAVTATNGTNGIPADASTSALNRVCGRTPTFFADGTHNVTWAVNVTQTSGTATVKYGVFLHKVG
jgi:hypothetical protein